MHQFFLHGVVLLGTAPPEELASKKDPVCKEGAQMCVCVRRDSDFSDPVQLVCKGMLGCVG